MQVVQPDDWPTPVGYTNGVLADVGGSGRLLFIAGQVGWNAQQQFQSEDFVEQVRQALQNVVSVLRSADAGPADLVRLTWYVTDKTAYRASLHEIGRAYREVIGRHYPAMTLVEVKALLEDRAKVEIEATAVIPVSRGDA